MKRKYLIGFLTILLTITLTACGKSSTKEMTCTKEEVNEYGYKTTTITTITYNDSKILKVKETNTSEVDPDIINDFTFEYTKAFVETLNNINGIKTEYKKIGENKLQMVTQVDYEKIDPEQVKQVFEDFYDENDMLTSKNLTIDEFLEKFMEGFSCK